ncbi:uncharacterized protein I303_107002 [Kwoniella dejecticola CBS 10117]|uniref:UDP-N-acetylglucosamine transferase subunit ALG14 n=1 Tax=Kwoniella dejecticola CBS 10117 TaxID=1296121 RepID=A0A1A5ZYF7_9TREE|nr:UDP-N-acetylglucosamine transferase subunit ALG14 [Kwoniella dejecticola CBS 10117]OBR82846.1 UDP-N-acetylglucosamine transferase subunit ALG14 [Kwoniella dejecticola CBS 10117]
MVLLAGLTAVLGLGVLLSIRIHHVLPLPHRTSRQAKRRNPNERCSIAIFLGSGGHTSEMKSLVSTLPFDRYTPRTYILCHNDEISLKAISSLESGAGTLKNESAYTILPLPRARKVAEPLLSTLISASKTFLVAFWCIFLEPLLRNPKEPFAEVLLINGPGTCVVLVLISYIRRILGLRYTKIIYVESFARVKSLSLSGKLVRPFVDKFLVQWPEAGGSSTKAECKGWLV